MKKQLFPRKKMVLGRKTIFFLGKTKKKHLLRHYAARHQKDVFFGFSLGKDGFGQEKQLFPRKKMVLGRKTNFFLGKTKTTIF